LNVYNELYNTVCVPYTRIYPIMCLDIAHMNEEHRDRVKQFVLTSQLLLYFVVITLSFVAHARPRTKKLQREAYPSMT